LITSALVTVVYVLILKIQGCKFKRSLFKRKMNLLIITQMGSISG